jgi:hypothetical protein
VTIVRSQASEDKSSVSNENSDRQRAFFEAEPGHFVPSGNGQVLPGKEFVKKNARYC